MTRINIGEIEHLRGRLHDIAFTIDQAAKNLQMALRRLEDDNHQESDKTVNLQQQVDSCKETLEKCNSDRSTSVAGASRLLSDLQSAINAMSSNQSVLSAEACRTSVSAAASSYRSSASAAANDQAQLQNHLVRLQSAINRAQSAGSGSPYNTDIEEEPLPSTHSTLESELSPLAERLLLAYKQDTITSPAAEGEKKKPIDTSSNCRICDRDLVFYPDSCINFCHHCGLKMCNNCYRVRGICTACYVTSPFNQAPTIDCWGHRLCPSCHENDGNTCFNCGNSL